MTYCKEYIGTDVPDEIDRLKTQVNFNLFTFRALYWNTGKIIWACHSEKSV